MTPPSIQAALALVRSLVDHGVHDVVLAPGSRSAPLAYAFAAAADAGAIDLHVRIDERSAGFLALGLSRGAEGVDGAPRPVAVVTTSGTAVANLHPAVLEAHHRGVPLVLLTADRPAELRDTGANQTTDQVGIFGAAVRYAVDHPAPDGRTGEVDALLALTTRALAAALGTRTGHPGPVHLNLAFRPPLVPGEPVVWADGAGGGRVPVVAPVVNPDTHLAAEVTARTVVVAGDGAGRVAREIAEARGWPLLAEPSSGAAGGPNLVRAHALVLDATDLGDDVENVVVLGRPTLTRPVQTLLAREGVRVVVVAPGGAPWPDAAANAAVVLPAVPDGWRRRDGSGTGSGSGDRGRDPAWLTRWRTAGACAARIVRAATDDTHRPSGPAVARAVVASCAPDDLLVVGSSSPIRDLDLVLGTDDVEAPVVLANRGVAGIDGTLSTVVGVALAAGRRGVRVRAFVGDLTFLHDVGGLLRGPLEQQADAQIVVVNDDGGSIFSTLEPGALAAASEAAGRTFERVFATPHGANLAHLCAGYGVDHQRVDDVASLRHALAAPSHGVRVIEIAVRRDDRRTEYEAMSAALRGAVGALG